jgi:hypothetical protein
MLGQGGAARNINGVDVWIYGTPPRPYMIVGYIEDSRPHGPIPMAQRLTAVANQARQAGADGVIMTSDNREFYGTYNTGSFSGFASGNSFYGSGSGMSLAMVRANSGFVAIKYVNSAPKQKA